MVLAKLKKVFDRSPGLAQIKLIGIFEVIGNLSNYGNKICIILDFGMFEIIGNLFIYANKIYIISDKLKCEPKYRSGFSKMFPSHIKVFSPLWVLECDISPCDMMVVGSEEVMVLE